MEGFILQSVCMGERDKENLAIRLKLTMSCCMYNCGRTTLYDRNLETESTLVLFKYSFISF